ncbi:MAG: hypothetical protein ACE5E1_06975 [Phycisphaerae bacterium]
MAGMELEARLDELVRVAESLDLVIRRVPLGGDGGGFCVIKGRRVLFIDTSADLDARYDRTLAALASLPGIETRYLPPEVRADLDRQRSES